MYITYDSNNSGGDWWVDDEGWKALEKAGWIVDWEEERFLGALATSAKKENISNMEEAVREWEKLTGCTATDIGCPCCGPPHHFTLYDDNGHIMEEGPNIEYSAHW